MAPIGARDPIRVLVTGPDTRQPGGAGISQHVRYLVQSFADDPGFLVEPFPITSVRTDEPWLWKGVRLLWRYAQLVAIVPRYDVVHVNSSIYDRSIVRDSGALLISALMRRPAVLQFHGGELGLLTRSRRGLLGRMARRALRGAACVLFLSAQQGDPVTREFGLARVRRVANYVPVDDYDPQAREPHAGLHVLFMGRLHPDKGAVESVAGFRKARRDGWELTVAGSGPAEHDVAEAIALTEGARFAGFVEGQERTRLLAWGDVFVLPSAHNEGMPYGVLEAAASGMAIVASDNAGLADLVREGWNGMVVPPLDAEAVAEALRAIGDEPSRLREMQRNSRDMAVREYSLAAGHEVFADIYREAATRDRGR